MWLEFDTFKLICTSHYIQTIINSFHVDLKLCLNICICYFARIDHECNHIFMHISHLFFVVIESKIVLLINSHVSQRNMSTTPTKLSRILIKYQMINNHKVIVHDGITNEEKQSIHRRDQLRLQSNKLNIIDLNKKQIIIDLKWISLNYKQNLMQLMQTNLSKISK